MEEPTQEYKISTDKVILDHAKTNADRLVAIASLFSNQSHTTGLITSIDSHKRVATIQTGNTKMSVSFDRILIYN